MMKSIFAALVLVVAASAQADVLKVDTKESSVAWKGMKKIGSGHHGGISVKEGQVQTDKKGQITSGNIVIDMTTITNEDLKASPTDQKKLVGHLSSDDFFGVAKNPTSTFKLLSATPNPKVKDELLVKGELTMIGKTNPIEFPAKVTTANGIMTGEAVVKVDRTKWGLKYGSGNFFKELSADKIISDEFEMTLKIVAKK